MFRGMWIKFENEIIRVWKDAGTRLVLVFPLVALLLFGYAVEIDVKSVTAVVLDLSRDAESRQLIQEFRNTGYFKLAGEVSSDQGLQAAIVSGRARVGIKITPDYSADLQSGRQGQVQVLIDGSDPMTALQILNSSQQIGFLKSLEREGITPAMFSIDLRPQLLFNTDLRSANYFIPGLIGILLQMASLFLGAFALGREGGALDQSPVPTTSKAGWVLGKLFAYATVGLAQIILLLLLMVFLFDVAILGSLPLLLLLSLVFIASSLGIGVVISTFGRSQAQVTLYSLLCILPVFFLSGFIFPRESMPPAIYILSLFIPATHYLEILRGIILRGAGIAALWDEAAALAAFAMFFLALGALWFKKWSG